MEQRLHRNQEKGDGYKGISQLDVDVSPSQSTVKTPSSRTGSTTELRMLERFRRFRIPRRHIFSTNQGLRAKKRKTDRKSHDSRNEHKKKNDIQKDVLEVVTEDKPLQVWTNSEINYKESLLDDVWDIDDSSSVSLPSRGSLLAESLSDMMGRLLREETQQGQQNGLPIIEEHGQVETTVFPTENECHQKQEFPLPLDSLTFNQMLAPPNIVSSEDDAPTFPSSPVESSEEVNQLKF